MSSNVLVTGAAGFIGTNFIYYWLKNNVNDNVIGLDSLTYSGIRENLREAEKNDNFKFVHCDINDSKKFASVLEDNKVSKIIHFAAESHVDRSIDDPKIFLNTNIIGTFNILNTAYKFWKKNNITNHHFHHISTDEVYGDLEINEDSFTEFNQYLPNSPYAASKASSDHMVRSFNKTYFLNTTISNCSNNYGPYQFPEKLIPVTIINILQNKIIPIYGNGKQIRDWLHVDDHCRGIDLIIKNGTYGETYNIGNNNEVTNVELVKKICKIINNEGIGIKNAESLITFVKDRPGHDKRYSINSNKIKFELDYKPSKSFNESLKETVRWYIDNSNWWKKLIKD